MPLTVLAAALAAFLAAEPEPETATPHSSPTSTATPTSPPTSSPTSPPTRSASPSPPDAEWVTGTGEPGPPSTPPGAPRNTPPMPHSLYYSPPPAPDWTLAAGWGATSLMGVTATGVEVTLEAGLPLAVKSRALPLVTADLFVGETSTGLAIRSFALGAEVWRDGGRLRAGGGVGSGLVGYRRATSGEWDFLPTVGIRAGIELAPLRFGSSEIVLGAHGAANLGPWYSGYFTLGYRWRAGPRR